LGDRFVYRMGKSPAWSVTMLELLLAGWVLLLIAALSKVLAGIIVDRAKRAR
jgi:hypothetical protein